MKIECTSSFPMLTWRTKMEVKNDFQYSVYDLELCK